MALDQKDFAIIGAFDKFGAKASAEQLSEVLGIPSRTVRYRLSRLKKKGILHPPRAMTHERKVGLGEASVCMKATRLGATHLPAILDELAPFYWMTESYGSYDGFLAHAVYSLDSPDSIPLLIIALKEEGLVEDYHIFDIVDYEYKRANYEYLRPDMCWNWDWKLWYKSIKRNLKGKLKFTFRMDENPQVVNFDSKDIDVLRHLGRNGESTQRHLAEALSLSETGASKRVQRLEKAGVIKGYKSTIIPSISQFSHCFFLEIEEPVERVLSSLYQLPFPLCIMMESRTRFCIRLGLLASDFACFLKGFDLLRPSLLSYFFQTLHNPRRTSSSHPFEFYNEDSAIWDIPSDSISIIREHLKKR
ncbi:MAG: winged helix-turn-helix transcriptional regulator [Candidatus Thorarchaeota archaeon]